MPAIDTAHEWLRWWISLHQVSVRFGQVQTSRPTLWHWQQRYLGEEVAGLRRGNTRPPRAPSPPREIGLKVMGKTVQGATQCRPLQRFKDGCAATPEDS